MTDPHRTSGLVHDAGGDTERTVLSPSGDERQFLSGKRKPVQVVQRQRDRALQGCRRRKAGPDRNVTVDEELDAGKFCPGFGVAPRRRRGRMTPTRSSSPVSEAPAWPR